MPHITRYVVQCFAETTNWVVAEDSLECCSEDEAMTRALTLRPTKAGVLVWMEAGDTDAGGLDDHPCILFRAGHTGRISSVQRRRR